MKKGWILLTLACLVFTSAWAQKKKNVRILSFTTDKIVWNEVELSPGHTINFDPAEMLSPEYNQGLSVVKNSSSTVSISATESPNKEKESLDPPNPLLVNTDSEGKILELKSEGYSLPVQYTITPKTGGPALASGTITREDQPTAKIKIKDWPNGQYTLVLENLYKTSYHTLGLEASPSTHFEPRVVKKGVRCMGCE